MQDSNITGMINALIEARVMSSIDTQKAKEVLQNYWADTVVDEWNTSDVQEKIQEALKKTVSDEDAKKVLLRVADEYDANFGITNQIVVDTAEEMAGDGLIEFLDYEDEEEDEN